MGKVQNLLLSSTYSPPSDWYLTDGVTIEDVLCAFDPKNAGNLAESLINLANPGAIDATYVYMNPPSLTTNGWHFSGAESLWIPTAEEFSSVDNLSACVRYSGIEQNNDCLFGFSIVDVAEMFSAFKIEAITYGNKILVGRSGIYGTDLYEVTSSGVMGITHDYFFKLGHEDVELEQVETTLNTNNNINIFIGADNYTDSPTPSSFLHGDIQEIAFYNRKLTPAQMNAIMNKMNTL